MQFKSKQRRQLLSIDGLMYIFAANRATSPSSQLEAVKKTCRLFQPQRETGKSPFGAGTVFNASISRNMRRLVRSVEQLFKTVNAMTSHQ